MIAIKDLDDATELDQPRRIRKYVLVWCSSGSVTIIVDESEFALNAGTVITITSGQIHYIKRKKALKGFVLEFTYDFFCKNDADIELIFHNSLFCHFAMNEVIPLGRSRLVGQELKKIEKELADTPYQYLISIHSRIELILVEINRAKVRQGAGIWKPDALFLKFLEAIRANFKNKHSVRQIAADLNTTESKLNELSELHTGKNGAIRDARPHRLRSKTPVYVRAAIRQRSRLRTGIQRPLLFLQLFQKADEAIPKSIQGKTLHLKE